MTSWANSGGREDTTCLKFSLLGCDPSGTELGLDLCKPDLRISGPVRWELECDRLYRSRRLLVLPGEDST